MYFSAQERLDENLKALKAQVDQRTSGTKTLEIEGKFNNYWKIFNAAWPSTVEEWTISHVLKWFIFYSIKGIQLWSAFSVWNFKPTDLWTFYFLLDRQHQKRDRWWSRITQTNGKWQRYLEGANKTTTVFISNQTAFFSEYQQFLITWLSFPFKNTWHDFFIS